MAQSSADWHRLLELCGLADVIIVDEQAVYTPRDFNDRLLLGLKGTMSEAELYWMRLRLEGGKLSKARRGELFFVPPAGYEWDAATARFRLDPDEQVQRAGSASSSSATVLMAARTPSPATSPATASPCQFAISLPASCVGSPSARP